jgi:hypothetical protein
MLIYQYPICVMLNSNNSATERVKVPIGFCATNLGFNHTPLCNECYCQPYELTDRFTTQLSLVTGTQELIRIDIYSQDGSTLLGALTDDVLDWQSTSSFNEFGSQSTTSYLMSTIRDKVEVDCFRITFVYEFEEYMSEPYCLVKCEEPTILICSDYDILDCNDKVWGYNTDYYTTPGTVTPMNNCMRLNAVLDYHETDIQNEYVTIDTSISSVTKHTKSKLIDSIELRVWGIPEWQVKLLKAVLGGKNLRITVNGETQYYQVKGGFNKGNTISSMWFPVIQLEQVCQIFNKSC